MNAVSFFLRDVISTSGALGGVEGPPPRVHSVRSVSTSVTFMRNWSFSKVLEAAAWRLSSVFAFFYLKDLSFQVKDGWSLGPFVSAGDVLS